MNIAQQVFVNHFYPSDVKNTTKYVNNGQYFTRHHETNENDFYLYHETRGDLHLWSWLGYTNILSICIGLAYIDGTMYHLMSNDSFKFKDSASYLLMDDPMF